MYHLTLQQLKDSPQQTIHVGTLFNSPEGVYISDEHKGKNLKWILKIGGAEDWAIYVGFMEDSVSSIESNGQKVGTEFNIKKLVDCPREVLLRYRY